MATTRYAVRIFFMAVLVAIAAARQTTAVVYHVGPAQSHTQLQQVSGLLNPGDTVLVDGDATYAGDITFTRAGTAGAPIVIKGVRINGHRPVLAGGTNTVTFESPWPYDSGADHYVLEGFEVTGGSFRGVYHQADDLTVRDVLVRDCPAHGILGADQGSGSCLLEFVEVRTCGNGSSQHQIYMATDEVHHPGSVFRMRHCYLHDGNGGNNVKSRAERNEIQYNWIEGGYYHELELIGCDGGDTGNVHLRREDSDVVGNVLRKRRTAAGNDSNFAVVRIGGDGTGMTYGRYRFVNNTIVCGTGAVFRCFDTLESVEMHNNVFYRPGGGVNLMRTVDAGWVHDTAIIAGSNNWVYSSAANVPAQWSGTMFGTDPGFTGYSSGDYGPLSGSPLVNAGDPAPATIPGVEFPSPIFPPLCQPPLHAIGVVALARPAMATIDIGAYEYEPAGIAGPDRDPSTDDRALLAKPNPFATATMVKYQMAAPGMLLAVVYNIAGQRVRTLANADRTAGWQTIIWDGRDDRGAALAGGTYIISIENDKQRYMARVMKIK